MTSRHWPLFDLRVRTPMLELRLPDQDDLDALADRALEGVHDPDSMPFSHPWTDAPQSELGRSVLLHHWRTLGAWTPEDWRLNLVVVCDGQVAGSQGIGAKKFGVLREVNSGSWLGRRYHRRGIGTEMRAAILHLAFAGLGAEHARSGAYLDNPASRGVSKKLGYRENGYSRDVRRGEVAVHVDLALSRADWTRRDDIAIDGLAPCLPLFGLGPATGQDLR